MFILRDASLLNLPWEALASMIKGVSPIDMHHMTVSSFEEAEQFLSHYGYDWSDETDRDELAGMQEEAISFIERQFLTPEAKWDQDDRRFLDLKVSDTVRTKDVRELLVLAAVGEGLEQRWACAILKVMHIVCHINNSFFFQYFEQAKAQILNRFYAMLSQTADGRLLLGNDEMGLSVLELQIKDEKSRDSMLLKLLSKRENVTEEVFDMMGVRIITETPTDAILALEVLRKNKLVVFPNIMTSRSRNSLVDVDTFKSQYAQLLNQHQFGDHDLNATLAAIRAIETGVSEEAFNPKNVASLPTYRSIHITQRQLIRFRPEGAEKEVRFFFPYEIQLLDNVSYEESLSGDSAHALYKRNQLIEARRRVLGPVLMLLKKKAQNNDTSQDMEPEPLT